MSERYRCGLVLGKFMPAHPGHVALLRFAAEHCERVVALLGVLPGEPLPGCLRRDWLEAALASIPNARVDYTEETLPTSSVSSRDVSRVWAAWLSPRYPEVDVIVSSEEYGTFVARYMGIASLEFDRPRRAVPLSATAFRDDPVRLSDQALPGVRDWLIPRVCLYGPESTGKTTMAAALARRFRASWVPEIARLIIGERAPERRDLEAIPAAHASAIREARQSARGILFVDSDILTTSVYARALFGAEVRASRWILDENRFDLWLLFYPDTPWIEDVQRDPGADRLAMYERFKAELDGRGLPYVTIRGDWEARERACVEAVLRRWPSLKERLSGD
jgi:HTH-type transcriptional repressor of NAD biosynthesis genes